MAKKKLDGVEPQETTEPASMVIPELEIFKKIATLSSLTSSVQDKEIVAVFNKQEHGKLLYEIFVKGVHQEVQNIISGNQPKAPAAITDAYNTANQLYTVVQTMYNMISAMSNSPVIKCMAIVNDNMTGTKMVDSIAMLAAKTQSYASEQREAVSQEQLAQQAVRERQIAAVVERESAAPAVTNPPVSKRYADTTQRQSSGVPAPTMPIRANKIDGMF